MPKVKHPNITLRLETAIRAGQYGKYLPPVRTLAGEFGVALQTMHKALRPLRENGLLSPGPGGTRVNMAVPRRDNIGVVTAFLLADKNHPVEIQPDVLKPTGAGAADEG